MKIRPITLVFSAISLVVLAIYLVSPTTDSLSMGTLYLIFPIAAALVAIYTSRIHNFNNANGRALLLITVGLVCWGIAETITYTLNSFTDNTQYPTIANFFILISYPIIGAGIYQGYIAAEIKLKQVKKSLLAVALSISLVLTALVAYYGVYQAYDSSADLLVNTVNMGGGVCDLILVITSMMTILVAREYKGGKLATFWKTISVGFFLFLIADIMFAMHGGQYTDDLYEKFMELTWIAAYIVLAFAMLDNYLNISAIQEKIKLQLLQRK